MKIILKQIRNHLNMRQTKFADWLGVSFATVNRWENGHAVPNKLAQTKLYEVCREKKIPVYEMILDKIKKTADNISPEKNRILLYHGSKSGIVGAIEPKSRKQCDFGKGFYMGTDPNQPLTLICDYEESKFYIVSICTETLERLVMKEAAYENRANGISLANDICKSYRREGKFFDEILDEAKGV